MSFTLEIWKEKATKQLHKIGDWVERRKRQDVPYLLYGTLCSLSLWPLLEAAREGQLLPVMMALGSVAAGVGGDLIANQVQRWKDQADKVQVAEWVIEHAPTDPDLRKALDDILEKLGAVTQAQAGLSEDDRQWFALTLREELSQLGNLTRFEAALSGSGAIAQGKVARAVGQGGVLVEGDVHGDVVTGQKTTLFNQRGQTVDRQVNIAGNWTGQDAPGVDDEKE